jgi:hypothetical protein
MAGPLLLMVYMMPQVEPYVKYTSIWAKKDPPE